ncbi:hypothetical protein Mal15_49870 [Stieleria maiorica]|uniref:Uncharacterized protein n=1 Tax=Stieleria maiorica TaxID=2795974 RepID=A0A5B9MLM7_9BACT|nr:hypothetical protein [Stieleria maiorica]QEG00911.1 hypothetical protein Mal15_49870 [Stieleria maiorica]
MKLSALMTAVAMTLSLVAAGLAGSAAAQTGITNSTVVVPTQGAALDDYLISRLRATTDDQRQYIREIVKLVDQNKLEKRVVLALERYARRKSPYFPLPAYERAMRVEAAKRRVNVPTLKEIVARNGVSAARAVRDSRFR